MAQLNHRGPLDKGPKTGRKLGLCKKIPDEKPLTGIGKGLGLQKRNQNDSCFNKGKRIRAHNIKNIN